jgi:hypothetical protein
VRKNFGTSSVNLQWQGGILLQHFN